MPLRGRNSSAALEKSVSENEGVMAACFNPCHDIRLSARGKKVEF
jgi:hypothetical protein